MIAHGPRTRLPALLLPGVTALLLVGCAADDASDDVLPEGTPDAAMTGDAPEGEDSAAPEAPLEFCIGSVRQVYDPLSSPLLFHAFPDDYYTVEDASTPTGLRVRLHPESTAWVDDQEDMVKLVLTDLEALDGWGTSGGVVLRFDADPGALDLEATAIWELGDGEAKRIPVEVLRAHEGKTAILRPWVPLAPATRHLALVTTDHAGPEGGCVGPSDTLRSLLADDLPPPELAHLVPRYAEAVDAVGIRADEVSAAVVFTTQSARHDSLAIAADLEERAADWKKSPICGTGSTYFRTCESQLAGFDYRDVQGRTLEHEPTAEWTIPATIWLPLDAPGPWPLMLFGHGLGGDRYQGQYAAQLLAPMGVAVAAIDAPFHGQHPTAPKQQGAFPTGPTDLLGVDLQAGLFDGLALRDNFRQATYDKLQLLRVLAAHPDLDGDGTGDLDPERTGYFGVSLGGIMASELVALYGAFDLVVLSVSGGRLSSVVVDGTQFGFFVAVLESLFPEPDDAQVAVPMVQALMEAGDGINWAGLVLESQAPPSVLHQVAIGDEIVPNSSNHALARALDLPPVGTVFLDPGPLPDPLEAPMSANLDESTTAGLFQIDRITYNGGQLQPASHNGCTFTDQGLFQITRFLDTWLEGSAPQIADPYEALGTPPLVP